MYSWRANEVGTNVDVGGSFLVVQVLRDWLVSFFVCVVTKSIIYVYLPHVCMSVKSGNAVSLYSK